MKPKILVTASTFPRWNNDPEPRFVLDLSKELQQQFEVTVLVPASPKAMMSEQLEGVNVLRYRYAPLRSLEVLAYPGGITSRLHEYPCSWTLVPLLFTGLYRAMRRLLAETNFACVHAHWAIPQGVIQGTFFSGRKNPPYVLTSHGADIYTATSGLKRACTKRALMRAAKITVVSEAIREMALEHMRGACQREDIQVIPMGASLARFNPEFRDEEWFAQYGLTRPVILFVGRLAEKKGLTYLLQALATPRLQRTSASLAIIGDGPLRTDLEREAAQRGITDRVCFTGALDHRVLPVAYASADIFCTPFIVGKDGDQEGLPTVLSEAGASGLASVASDVGGVREIIIDGQTGFLVPQKDPECLTDKLYTLINDSATRKRFGVRALQAAEAFSWENIGKKYAQVIHDVIEERAVRR
jgi:glycosyltransferase involved in cell wall biosynthesis